MTVDADSLYCCTSKETMTNAAHWNRSRPKTLRYGPPWRCIHLWRRLAVTYCCCAWSKVARAPHAGKLSIMADSANRTMPFSRTNWQTSASELATVTSSGLMAASWAEKIGGHVGDMSPRQPNVGTFCPNAPVVATQFWSRHIFLCRGLPTSTKFSYSRQATYLISSVRFGQNICLISIRHGRFWSL